MSGTSLDGLDLAYCKFELQDQAVWKYSILQADTIEYPESIKELLVKAPGMSGMQLIKLDRIYGRFIGEQVKKFKSNISDTPMLIASHGHTVFHNPGDLLTYQLGSGAAIAATTQITTICDFRTIDMELNGQGAPLVPIGDRKLFGQYDMCLNLGGFANISFEEGLSRKAFDICPVNIALNLLSSDLGYNFDKNGELGKKAQVNAELIEELNKLDYYDLQAPKSLGREWLEKEFLPLVDSCKTNTIDKLRTLYEHIAIQLSSVINKTNGNNIFVTGGGAKNSFLIQRLNSLTKKEIIIPNEKIIDYKEALLFAFLGVLRLRKESNCLASVTGADHDNIGGCIYL
ncbi:MAG: anhydro-N-acetylmuramic acid kinase [Marinilabiliales bacterium]|nr:MAG: anhydro-N-acetylmuramic acid kinase [Marinilabiliales bacterium]